MTDTPEGTGTEGTGADQELDCSAVVENSENISNNNRNPDIRNPIPAEESIDTIDNSRREEAFEPIIAGNIGNDNDIGRSALDKRSIAPVDTGYPVNIEVSESKKNAVEEITQHGDHTNESADFKGAVAFDHTREPAEETEYVPPKTRMLYGTEGINVFTCYDPYKDT